MQMLEKKFDFDFIIIGSGFGGSVSALRLSEKGYSVLVLEQGRRFNTSDFPKTNWNLRKWLWVPFLRFYGFFRIGLFRHITVLAGAGVGGGSLVYANTLPVPRKEFYHSGSWAKLLNWEFELSPYYETAAEMLGAVENPHFGPGDLALEKLSHRIGKSEYFEPTRVAVYFGEPEKVVADPFFKGLGPEREGCRLCGGCMVGCRYNAKNTLDKNYLYLAEKLGTKVLPEMKVTRVRKASDKKSLEPDSNSESNGYIVNATKVGRFGIVKRRYTARSVIFSGGVLGTIPLLLKLKKNDLPNISNKLGYGVRTNNEALIGVISKQKHMNFSEGVAIGSIVHTDQHSHLEPVRYPSGSGFWRLLMAPMLSGRSFFHRLLLLIWDYIRHPVENAKAYFVKNWGERAQILLFMQTIDSKLRLKRSLFGIGSRMEDGDKPSAFIPEAQNLANQYAEIVNGKPLVLPTETLFGIPTTAHILGGACMGEGPDSGVIDQNHRVFNYPNLYIIDGSSVSANPGVNPSLTIAALAERAIDQIPEKSVFLASN